MDATAHLRHLRGRVSAALMGVALIGSLFAPVARAATTITVSPNNMQGWAFFDDKGNGGTGVMVPGPATPPLGTGSAELAVTASNQGYALGTGAYVGTALSAITNLSYWSYQPGPVLAIALQFDIKYRTADTTYDGRLVYEPYQNGHVTVGSGWQTWSPLSGIWWASNQTASGGLCPMGSPCPWATVLATWPQATISGAVLFKAGSGWSSFTGNVDDFTIGVSSSDTTYDFEPGPPCTTDCYVSTTGNDLAGGASFADAKRTIQAAVNQVSSGGTVHVAAGIYVENVDVTTSATIEGAGQGSTIVEPAVSNPNPCVGSSLCGGTASNVFLVEANDVTITGLTVDGDNPHLTSGIVRNGADLDARNGIIVNYIAGTFGGLSVHDVTVQNIYLRGIYQPTDATFDFEHDTVTNVQGDGYSIGMFAWYGPGVMAHNAVSLANDGISANHSRGIQFLDNTVTDSGSGVHTDNAGDSGGVADVISGNTVSCAPNGYGVWDFVPYIAPTISNNTVTNCAVGLAAFGGAFSDPSATTTFSGNRVDGAGVTGSVGAYVWTGTFGYGDMNVNATFIHDTIIHNDVGVQVDESADSATGPLTTSGTATATVALHYNVIAGNTTVGLTTNSAGTIDATNNWWGCSGGPGSSCNGVSGNVNANPWLVDHVTIPTTVAPINSTISGTVDLTHNSNGDPAGGTVPDGTTVTFSSTSAGMTGSGTTTGGTATVSISTGSSANLYNVCAEVPTTYGAPEGCTSVAVYDPSGGFVTGGGWITSNAGYDTLAPTASGKATFAFVSKYQKGATVPSGNTAFVFKTGGLDFESTAYQWLVVNQNGTNAQFKGTGTINGAGTYDFMIWATDGSPDTFRIRITDSVTGNVVYDNGVAQAIGGGSIIVHS